MAVKPAIVVCTYNRPTSLGRLLNSLNNSVYPGNNIPLVISIDKSENKELRELANNFEWLHGTKKIIEHASHLGLKEHVLACGDLTEEYDEIILLEDDLFVAPYFYDYAVSALAFYKSDPKIAGISLYNYEVAESCFRPFKAITDGYDVYFMQVASSWGQSWNRQQWQSFRQWFSVKQNHTEKENIPGYLNDWGYQSWKKHFIHYLIDQDRFFVFPRVSFSTNFEDPGTHASGKKLFQSTLATSESALLFCELNNSGALYDAWFEIKPQSLARFNQRLFEYDYTTDLYGTKNKKEIGTPFILTSADLPDALIKFDDAFFPLENNIALGLKGEKLGLYKTESVDLNKRNCRLTYLLEERYAEKEMGFSLVIPYLKGEAELLKLSLNSFVSQTNLPKELLVVVNSKHYEECEKVVSYTNLNVRLISLDKEENTGDLILSGMAQTRYEVLCWMRSGSVLQMGAFNYVETVFRNFSTVSVVRGISSIENINGRYSDVNTRPYRFIPSDLHRILKSGREMPDTQLFFIRKHCIEKILPDVRDYNQFLYKLLTNFPINVMVIQLGNCVTNNGWNTLKEEQRRWFLTELGKTEDRTRWSTLIIYWLLRTPFFSDNSWRWYLTTLKNYPFVLRFDERNSSFFIDKH